MMMFDIPAETVHRPVSLYNERITHFCRVLQRDYKMCSVMLMNPPFVIGKHCKKKNAFDAACVLIKEKLCRKTKFPWRQSLTELICLLFVFSGIPSWTVSLSSALASKPDEGQESFWDFCLFLAGTSSAFLDCVPIQAPAAFSSRNSRL